VHQGPPQGAREAGFDGTDQARRTVGDRQQGFRQACRLRSWKKAVQLAVSSFVPGAR
jgi:hypothetical protein